MESGGSDADAVLMLHGIGGGSPHWRFQFAGLADRFRLIAWNAPGYFLTDNLRAETPSARDYADALCDFASAVGVAHREFVRHAGRTMLRTLLSRANFV